MATEPVVERNYGKYTVTGVLGRGGMGVVYRAKDPDLERDVAVKVLRRPAEATGDGDRARLLREAKALARLSHPNVVSVFDVGDAGGELYVAMELIEGHDLRTWLAADKRSVGDIIDVFIGAGQGLLAAHAAGLVHRDFKPTNVLVGTDGRARVTDFGLARTPREGTQTPQPVALEQSLKTELTADGVVVGTPAYMAPEQHERRQLSPAADQYGFCVALHEAIYGTRPFTGERLYRDKLEGPPAVPRRKDVPPRVARAIARGMSPAPAGRHASMETLLQELAQDNSALRRRVLLVGGIVAAAFGAWAWGQVGASEAPCAFEASAFAEAWDAEAAAEVKVAFEASGRPYAAAAFERLAGELDGYAGDWVTARREVCEESEQPESLHDQRVACLEAGRDRIAALSGALRQADAAVVDRVGELVRALPPIDHCRDAAAVRVRVPDPESAQVARAVRDLRARLATTSAALITGHYADAEAQVEAMLPAVRELDYAPLTAEVLVAYGEALDALARHAEAEAVFEEAAWAAYSVGYDEFVAIAAHKLVWNLSDYQGRVEEGLVWAKLAQTTVERGNVDPLLRASVANAHGALLHDAGRYEDAVAQYDRALALVEEHAGKDALHAAGALVNLAVVESARGRHPRALALQERALAIREAAQGREHPDTALLLNNMSGVLLALDRTDEALATNRDAVERLTAAFGDEHPSVAMALAQRGSLLYDAGKRGEALVALRRAAAMLERTRGPNSLGVAVLHSNIGYVLLDEGDAQGAREAFAHALSIYKATGAPSHPATAAPRVGLARALHKLGEQAEAKRLYDDVLTRIRAGEPGGLERTEDAFLGAADVYDALGDKATAAALRREAQVEG